MWEGKRVADSFRERMLAAAKADRAQEKILSRRIAALYEKAAEDMASKAADSRSGSLTQRHAWELTQSLRERTQDLWSQVGDLTRAGMREAALRSVGVQTTFLEDAGRMAQLDLRQSIRGSFGSVADDAVQHVLQGGVYGGKSPTLSKRIWNNAAMQSGKIEDIIAQAVAKGESPQTLAKALEAYVNPGAIEPSNWNDIYDIPFTYKVDYNAKRLAVTSLRHASWGATLRAGEKNPYADFFQWELTSAHVIYDVCDGYAVHEEGLGEGRYALNSPQLPLPHPFCTCLYYIDTDKTLDQVAEELVSWADGTRDDPKLDRAFGRWEREGLLSVDIGSDSDIIKAAQADLEKQSEASLKRGIESLQKRIEEHLGKIDRTQDESEMLVGLDLKRKQGLMRHWAKEIVNFRTQITRSQRELLQRGVDIND